MVKLIIPDSNARFQPSVVSSSSQDSSCLGDDKKSCALGRLSFAPHNQYHFRSLSSVSSVRLLLLSSCPARLGATASNLSSSQEAQCHQQTLGVPAGH